MRGTLLRMKWMIGLDLRPEGRGALAFVRWIRDTVATSGDQTFLAVHVLEEYALLSALRTEQLATVEMQVQAAAKTEIDRAGLSDVLSVPNLLQGVDADVGLVDQAEANRVDAIVIGRKADVADSRWERLGRVARRLLRTLPAPTIVVPPDLDPTTIGDGPILLATDATDDSIGAAEFAKRMGTVLNRPVVVAHIVPTFDAGASYVPAATIEQLYHQLGMEREKSLETWKRDQGLQSASTILATGDVVGRMVAIAKEERVPLVVCGSRRMNAVARIFNASVGSTLAGYCTCPVAVVPPPAR
jgi:nucleotide-binding universal stress UspA family protein